MLLIGVGAFFAMSGGDDETNQKKSPEQKEAIAKAAPKKQETYEDDQDWSWTAESDGEKFFESPEAAPANADLYFNSRDNSYLDMNAFPKAYQKRLLRQGWKKYKP